MPSQYHADLHNGTHPVTADSNTAIADTDSGKVAGYLHRGIFTFKGIPYAKAARFMPPSKPDAWEGIRSSRAYGPVCPIDISGMVLNDEMEFAQQHHFGVMNENCQNLNIWTPGLTDGQKRPVMVWLHGGGYYAGSSCELPTYDGENLSLRGDTVIVSLNHRLNVLGFLDLSGVSDKYRHSANAGMLDIVAALEWIRDNIASFGGDPDNVTIFGQSGGAGKVATLLFAPTVKGLFHRAIMQSGGFPTIRPREESKQIGPLVLEALNIPIQKAERIQDIPFELLLDAGNRAFTQLNGESSGMLGLSWSPAQDNTFLRHLPEEPGMADIAKNVPLMIGTNKTEFGLSVADPELFAATESDVRTRLQPIYGDKTEEFMATYKTAYPESPYPSDMIDFDMIFRPGTIKLTDLKASVPGGAPVYSWLFKWNAPLLGGRFKSIHCMEIAFVFDNIARNEEYNGGTPEAYELADRMSDAWLRFAKSGNPNHSNLPEWPPYTQKDGSTMLFDNTCEVTHHHDRALYQIAGAL